MPRELVLSRSHPPGRLKIEQPILYPVQRKKFQQHQTQGCARHGGSDYQLTDRVLETFKMRSGIDQAPGSYVNDFIYAIGELKSAILDVHASIRVAQIAAVYVGKARHGPPPGGVVRALFEWPLGIIGVAPDGLD